MKNWIRSILDLIYKRKCYCCSSSVENSLMCSKCYDELVFCDHLPSKFVAGVDVYCAGIYNKNLQKLIRGVKYHKKQELAVYIAKFLYEYWKDLNPSGDYEIVPVPLHSKRLKKRKYNQAELIAKEFAKLTGYSINTELVKRTKDTLPQYKLSRIQRLDNLKDAFVVDKAQYHTGKKLLLLDDISTTGSTFETMVNSLRYSGINNIVCLAVATPF